MMMSPQFGSHSIITFEVKNERAYILRVHRSSEDGDEYIPVSTFTITDYQCGLRAGDQLRLRNDMSIANPANSSDQRMIRAGTIWTVLTGAEEDPTCLWSRDPEGKIHSWDDDASIFDAFEKITPG